MNRKYEDPAVSSAQRTRVNEQSYERLAPHFLERNRDRSILRPWMERFKHALPTAGAVLDLGAGPCLDAAELGALGLHAIALDRSRAMLNAAADSIHVPRVMGDIRQLPFRRGCFAGVWASASLLHLDRAELALALRGIRDVLVPAGALFVSLKHGKGEREELAKYGVETPRWFTYYDEDELDGVLRASGFELVESATRDGRHERWLLRIARSTFPAAPGPAPK
jgi:SAM-dependent methyltransferase